MLLWIKTTSALAAQTLYLVLLSFVWKAIGWQGRFSHGFGWVTFFLLCVVNPWLCAYLGSQFRKRYVKWLVALIFLGIVLICPDINNNLWLYNSGYYKYFTTPGFSGAGETWAVIGAANGVQIVISGILFVLWYARFVKRQHKTRDNDINSSSL